MRTIRLGAMVAAAVMLGVLLAAAPAAADVGLSQSMTVPATLAVGQTASASFTVRNTNTPPHQSESQNVTSLRLALGCGGVGTTANPCSTPDPGIFSASAASGGAGTACAGVTFNVSAPDVNGVVTFTPTSPVVLGPPSATGGPDRCTVNFTLRALKVPGIDSNAPAAGVQTRINFVSRTTSVPSNLSPTASSTTEVTVVRATPTITTQATPPSTGVGGTIVDTATVGGVAGIAAPTGTVIFRLFGPGDATCSGAPVFQSTNAVSGGTATSGPYVVTQPGVYRYTAAYSGDANYLNTFGVCNAANESVNVVAAPVTAQFTSPTPGQTNVTSDTPFTWTPVAPGAEYFWLYVGTTQGSADVYTSPGLLPITQTSASPTLVPNSTLWARIHTYRNGAWTHSDVSFTTAPSLGDA